MKKHYLGNVRGNEASIDWLLSRFDEKIKAIKNGYGYASYGANSTSLDTLASGYFCSDSKHYKNSQVLDLMNDVLTFIDSLHRPNYTIDMMESNFYCAPLFEAINMARAYRIIDKYAQTDREKDFLRRYREYLPKVEKSLLNGGIHTPNHRWIGTSAMMMMANILKSDELRKMGEAYLNEGIDMDEFGEFTERSPHYNEVCDTSFMQIALETGKMEYLEYAKKNMDLMFNYIEPNFTVFTQNSNRQDKHEGDINAITPPNYLYYTYAHMAYITKNGQYARFADDIYNSIVEKHGRGPGSLHMYMLYPELLDFDPVLEDYPTSYNIFHKDIVRFKKDDFSATLITRSPNFLFVQKGDLRCFVRICASFFAVAQFKPLEINKIEDNTYQMKMKAHGEYYGPMSEKPSTSKWKEMDHSLRPVNNMIDLEYTVTVKIEDDRAVLNVRTEECDNVPMKIEFCLSAPVTAKFNNEIIAGEPDGNLCVNAEEILISKGQDALKFTNSFCNHTYHKDMRGSIPPSKGAFTVYYTGFTHIDKKIDIIGTKEA